MTERKNLLLCLNFAQKVINERDLSLVPKFIAAESVQHEFGDVPRELQGGPRAMTMFLSLYMRAFPDLRVTFEDALVDRDRVVTRWHLEGTQTGPLMGIAASGRRVHVEGIRIDRIENEQIAESWMQLDMLGLLEQIGALPELRRNLAPQVTVEPSRRRCRNHGTWPEGWPAVNPSKP
ncbi:MAG TPA: ester cyclase, partial [Thermoanaerobaculia bacterium]|nr:ester cyclase [Thermoanaerobaculia bacterium]